MYLLVIVYFNTNKDEKKYAKENDREKRERRREKSRRRDIEREVEIRERDVSYIERE